MSLHNKHEGLAALIGKKLMQLGRSVATVESCSGGGIACSLTAIAGSSNWFERGYVTYSNAAKIEAGVSAALLRKYGAVSNEVATSMALAGRKHADYALSVTGIAGPGGGTKEKPVGTVYFAWAGHDAETEDDVQVEKVVFVGNRDQVRQQTIIHSLTGLLKILDNTYYTNR